MTVLEQEHKTFLYFWWKIVKLSSSDSWFNRYRLPIKPPWRLSYHQTNCHSVIDRVSTTCTEIAYTFWENFEIIGIGLFLQFLSKYKIISPKCFLEQKWSDFLKNMFRQGPLVVLSYLTCDTLLTTKGTFVRKKVDTQYGR